MISYLDFRTAPEHHDSLVFADEPFLASDNFVVRTDTVPVQFTDETIPQRLAEAIAKGRERQARRYGNNIFDCYYFAAAMHQLPMNKKSVYGFTADTEAPVTAQTMPETDVVIGRGYHDIPIVQDHIIVPAHHILDGTPIPQYLHKLGIEGPICISSLEKSMQLMGSNKAYPAIRL